MSILLLRGNLQLQLPILTVSKRSQCLNAGLRLPRDHICHFGRELPCFSRDGLGQSHLPGVGVPGHGKAGYKVWSHSWRLLCPATEFKNLLLANQPIFLTPQRGKNSMDICGFINIEWSTAGTLMPRFWEKTHTLLPVLPWGRGLPSPHPSMCQARRQPKRLQPESSTHIQCQAVHTQHHSSATNCKTGLRRRSRTQNTAGWVSYIKHIES